MAIQESFLELAVVTIQPSGATMDDGAFGERSVFDAVIDECLSEASIGHDVFQVNERVWLQIMLHEFYSDAGNRTRESNGQ